ncbi:MAG: hypothetical protein CMJ49_09795 [Planctomycetaceae bacterium]|nr:hypothetical protein [Planctomycetaceae bacterium]
MGLNAVEALSPIHSAQVVTHLRTIGERLGLLVNFNTGMVKDGVKRVIL